MCTAITLQTGKNYYFGRTLDVCASRGESVVITPKGYLLDNGIKIKLKHAVMGTAYVAGDYPLYYDGMNEAGLCAAGLNFPKNAKYFPVQSGKKNVPPFAFIPFILGQCATLAEAEKLLKEVSIADINFSKQLPNTPLHWIIGDKSGEITVESVEEGLKVYKNPVGVLTNNPQFPAQLFNLNNYPNLSSKNPQKGFCELAPFNAYSRGMGGLGMPGDWSSPSRFVRAAFVKTHYPKKGCTADDFLEILNSVRVPRGCVDTEEGNQYTVYSCCFDTAKGEYSCFRYANLAKLSLSFKSEKPSGLTILKH